MEGNRTPGKYFEEWNVGDTYVTNGRTISMADIVLFASLSGDHNPLHTNILYAKNSVFGERVAHGFLILAISSGQINQMRLFEGTTEAFLGLSELTFSKGVLPGDTITSIGTILEKRLTSQGRGLLRCQVQVVNQKGEICSNRIGNFFIKRKPPEAEGA
jgi:acyl dehydratase